VGLTWKDISGTPLSKTTINKNINKHGGFKEILSTTKKKNSFDSFFSFLTQFELKRGKPSPLDLVPM